MFYTIDIAGICQEADTLVSEYETRNPSEIADKLHIIIKERNLDYEGGSLKAFSASFFGKFCICINKSLDEKLYKCILTHEIGHVVLHKDILKNDEFIYDFEIVSTLKGIEAEANFFASEILISDDDIKEASIYGYDVYQLASMLGIPVEFVVYKLKILNFFGKCSRYFDIPDSKFLR